MDGNEPMSTVLPHQRELPLPLSSIHNRVRNAKTSADAWASACALLDAVLAVHVGVCFWQATKAAPPAARHAVSDLFRPSAARLVNALGTLSRALAETRAVDMPISSLYGRLLGRANSPGFAALFSAANREDLASQAQTILGVLDGLVALRETAGTPLEAQLRSCALLFAQAVTDVCNRLAILPSAQVLVAEDWRDPVSAEHAVRLVSLESGVAHASAVNGISAGEVYLETSGSVHGVIPLCVGCFDEMGNRCVAYLAISSVGRGLKLAYFDPLAGQIIGEPDALSHLLASLTLEMNDAVGELDAAKLLQQEARRLESPISHRTLPKAETIGGMEIIKKIGQGGMADVYQAWQPGLGRMVALKVLPADVSRNPIAVARFKAEVVALGMVQHPNLVAIYTTGQERGSSGQQRHYYAMEFVKGVDLGRLFVSLSKQRQNLAHTLTSSTIESSLADAETASEDTPFVVEGPLRADSSYYARIARLVAQAARGVQHLHERGIVHRDVKPANIMVAAEDGRAVVMDLGLARLWNSDLSLGTRSLLVLGTVRYMAPEQIGTGAHTVTPAADVYSLGATLFELATLKPFVKAPTLAQLQFEIVHGASPEPRSANPSIPTGLATIIETAISKAPYERFESAAHFADQLEAFAAGQTIPPRPRSKMLALLPAYFDKPAIEVTLEDYRAIALAISKAASDEDAFRTRLAYTGTRHAKKLNRAVELRLEAVRQDHLLVPHLRAIMGAKTREDAFKARAATEAPQGHNLLDKSLAETLRFLMKDKEVKNSLGMNFRLISAGRFEMGDEEMSHNPLHWVNLSSDFYMGSHLVTNAQFRAFRAGHDSGEVQGFTLDGEDQPAVFVSWNEAEAFCKWLSEREGRVYRLPTEAEWEYCARCGRSNADSKYPWMNGGTDRPHAGVWPPSGPAGNFADLTSFRAIGGARPHGFDYDDGFVVTSPVGSFPPNLWGLFDMCGNAWEWCSDWYDPMYCMKDAVDPKGPPDSTIGLCRVARGCGTYRNCDRKALMTGMRGIMDGYPGWDNVGLRVVLEILR